MSEYNEVVELAKRRGFFWPSFSIYGGQSGFYDYGPVGVLLKENIVNAWRRSYLREGAIFIDTPNLSPAAVFRASGHLEKFADLAVQCTKCRTRFKLESLLKENGIEKTPSGIEEANSLINEKKIKCSSCGSPLGEAYDFNLMFKMEHNGNEEPMYLRPETAQGMFINFKQLNNIFRGKLPMAVAQLGKAFRNEISPRQSLIRLRELTQGEVEVFFDPDNMFWKDVPDGREVLFQPNNSGPMTMTVKQANESGLIRNTALAYFVNKTFNLLMEIGIGADRIRFRQHRPDELAHYSSDCWDAEVVLDEDWVEIVGISHRGQYDLTRHQDFSKDSMTVTIDGKSILPAVIEPAHGIDRMVMSVLMKSYHKRENNFKVMSFLPEIAPFHAAILPLQRKDGLPELARSIHEKLSEKDPYVAYDETGSIGKRYARQDEIGTPFCITVDYQTAEDGTVTIRERDSTSQIRVNVSDLEKNPVLSNEKVMEFVRSLKS